MSLTAKEARQKMVDLFTDKDQLEITKCDQKIMEALHKGRTYTSCDYFKKTELSLKERGFDAEFASDYNIDRDMSKYKVKSWLGVSWN